MKLFLSIIIASVLMMFVGTPIQARQQTSFIANSRALSATAIPGEWVEVLIQPEGQVGKVGFQTYWAPHGVSLFGARSIEVAGTQAYLARFFVDSAMTPGSYEVTIQCFDEAHQVVHTTISLMVGPGFPRELGDIADQLSSEVAITHANQSDGRFQAIAHFKSRKTLKATAQSYRNFLSSEGWTISQNDLFQSFGYIKAEKNGQVIQVGLEINAINRERVVTVALDFP